VVGNQLVIIAVKYAIVVLKTAIKTMAKTTSVGLILYPMIEIILEN